jgi:hypothetical protein
MADQIMDCGGVQGTTAEFTDEYLTRAQYSEVEMRRSWPGVSIWYDPPRRVTMVKFKEVPSITTMEAWE